MGHFLKLFDYETNNRSMCHLDNDVLELIQKKGKNSASYNSDIEVEKPSKEKQSDVHDKTVEYEQADVQKQAEEGKVKKGFKRKIDFEMEYKESNFSQHPFDVGDRYIDEYGQYLEVTGVFFNGYVYEDVSQWVIGADVYDPHQLTEDELAKWEWRQS